MITSKLIAATAMTAAVLGGAVIGATVGNPLTSGAQDSELSTTNTAPAPEANKSESPKSEKGERKGHMQGFSMDEILKPAADALNMTTDELRSELSNGKSLATIAKEKGVDRKVLVDALVKAAEAKIDELKAKLPEVIDKAIDVTPPKMGEGFGKGKDGKGPMNLDEAADALGTAVDDLWSQLEDGQTLADIAKNNGVDQQKVIDTMTKGIKAHLDSQVKAGKITQAEADKRLAESTKRITDMVNNGFDKAGQWRFEGHGDKDAPKAGD